MVTKTYTPTSFREHCYDLFNRAKDNKNRIQVTVRNGAGKPNSDILLINKANYLKLVHENKVLKEARLEAKLDHITKKLSSNPVIKTPKQLNEWFEKHDD